MRTFIRNPTTVEAIQIGSDEATKDVLLNIGGGLIFEAFSNGREGLAINTPDGVTPLQDGDWIVKDGDDVRWYSRSAFEREFKEVSS